MQKQENDRFSKYGGDDGKHTPEELNRIRFLWALSHLETMLKCHNIIGAVRNDGKPLYAEPETFTAEQALKDFYELEDTLQDVYDLSNMLPSSERLDKIKIALNMIDFQSIETPVKDAIYDGNEEAAITLLRDVVFENYEQVGYKLKELSAEYGFYELNIGEQNKTRDESQKSIYMAIDLVNRTITVGAESVFIKGESLWEYLKELCSKAKQNGIVPYLEGAKNYKNANDQLRKLIGKDNLHKFIVFADGYGYKLNSDVKILNSGQIGIRKTRLSRRLK